MTALEDLGGHTSSATALNNEGIIIGWAYPPTDRYQQHGVIWEKGRARDLGGNSTVYAVNDANVVVGNIANNVGGSRVSRAVAWRGSTTTDLNTLLPAGSGWVLQYATGINNRGQICGVGTLNGQPRYFLMTPAE